MLTRVTYRHRRWNVFSQWRIISARGHVDRAIPAGTRRFRSVLAITALGHIAWNWSPGQWGVEHDEMLDTLTGTWVGDRPAVTGTHPAQAVFATGAWSPGYSPSRISIRVPRKRSRIRRSCVTTTSAPPYPVSASSSSSTSAGDR